MGKRRKRTDPFDVHRETEDLRREKQRARELRASQWWKRQCARGVCHWCNRPTPAGELTMDHIVPMARGGRSVRGNVVPCCKTCNTEKKHLLPMEWDAYLAGIRKNPETEE